MVDVTTIDFGRDAQFIQEVATAANLPVVVCTGLWNVPLFFQWRPQEVAEQFFVAEITDGIHGSTVKAGVIKITSNDTLLTAPQEKIFRAAARAHRKTGVPISTHTEASHKCGVDQQRVLAEEGVDLTRVIIGHSETEDYDYLRRLLDRGSYLRHRSLRGGQLGHSGAAARMGRPTHAQRLRIVASLCREGYAAQLLLSHDTAGISVFPVDWYDQTYPNARFDYIPCTVVPGAA